MAKKICKILVIAFIVFFAITLLNSVYAREVSTINELGAEILSVNPNAESAYVVGNYVFTSAHMLTTQDVMLAARSIDVVDTDGKIDTDDIYGEMTVYSIWADFDSTGNITGWSVKNNLVGTTQWDLSKMDIIYIDYNQVVNVTFDYGYDNITKTIPVKMEAKIEKPEDPTREGYEFKGWYLGDTEYNFDTPVNSNITLTAKWALDVDAIVEKVAGSINPERYEITVDGNNVAVVVKIDAVSEKITAGGSGIMDNLKETLKNEDIETLTVSFRGNTLTVNKDTTLDEAKTWIATLIPGKEINTITNGDFADKEFTVTVDLKDGVLSTNDNNVYRVKVEAQTEINVDDKVEEAIEQIDADKYDVDFDSNLGKVKVTVSNTVRRESILDGRLNVINILTSVFEDERIDSIVVSADGKELEIKKDTAHSVIKDWIQTYIGKEITEITHNDFEGKNFAVSVNLSNNAVTEETHAKSEAYTIEILLEAYEEINVNNLVTSAVEKINANASSDYVVKLDNITATVAIKNDSAIGFDLLTTLKDALNATGVESIEIEGIGIIDRTTTVEQLKNKVNITNNSQLVGKQYTVKVNVSDGYVDTSAKDTYTVIFKREANIGSMQTSAINAIDATALDVSVANSTIAVKIVKPEYTVVDLMGTGVKTSLVNFLNNPSIKDVTITIDGKPIIITKAYLEELEGMSMSQQLDEAEKIGTELGITEDTLLTDLMTRTITVDVTSVEGYTITNGASHYTISMTK